MVVVVHLIVILVDVVVVASSIVCKREIKVVTPLFLMGQKRKLDKERKISA